MKYRFFFDYIHFRINKKVYRRDSDGFSGVLAITLSQMFFLTAVWSFSVQILFGRKALAEHADFVKYVLILIFGLLVYLNRKKHYGKYWKYSAYWKDESESKRIVKGWLVVICLLVPFVVFVIVSNFALAGN